MQRNPGPLRSYVESWAPEAVTDVDDLHAAPVAALSALLDEPAPVATAGDPLPPLWHWLYFLRWPAQRDLGADGHPRHGHFLPPVPDRQRMVAGGRCTVDEPLRLGERAERVSSLGAVTTKRGRSGELLFVTQRHELRQRGRTCLVEEQDIVYRSGRTSTPHTRAALDPSATARPDGHWHLPLHPDPPLLFRFSALTANAHRIHYDTPYARDVEGYPGLVVHGPLIATLLVDLFRRSLPRATLMRFTFRALKPLYDTAPFATCGVADESARAARLWTRDAAGEVTMEAQAEYA
jgi:3-methylfumaryl-CoA hydratase